MASAKGQNSSEFVCFDFGSHFTPVLSHVEYSMPQRRDLKLTVLSKRGPRAQQGLVILAWVAEWHHRFEATCSLSTSMADGATCSHWVAHPRGYPCRFWGEITFWAFKGADLQLQKPTAAEPATLGHKLNDLRFEVVPVGLKPAQVSQLYEAPTSCREACQGDFSRHMAKSRPISSRGL